jgi:SAM-dependent methyltransferase
MTSQKKFWTKEHREKKTFPGIYESSPASVVVDFEKTLSGLSDPEKIHILDLGAGTGRNAIYLANKGYKVTAADFVEDVISQAESANKIANLTYRYIDIAKPWKFIKNASLNIILDIYTSICIRQSGRKTVIKEAFRTLKKGGLYFFAGIGLTDWVKLEPGPEVNSTVFPDSGKFEKQFTKEELLQDYKQFALVNYHVKNVFAKQIAGRPRNYPVVTAVFKK